MTCRNKNKERKKQKEPKYHCIIHFFRRPDRGGWALQKTVDHSELCTGQCYGDRCSQTDETTKNIVSKSTYVFPAYNANQVARMIIPTVAVGGELSTGYIATIVAEKDIYQRQPSLRRFRAVISELSKHMNSTRQLQMA